MARIVRVEPIERGPEIWVSVARDDGTGEVRLLKPFDVVPKVETGPDEAAPPAATAAERRARFTVVQGGKQP